ncbi:MAG: LysR family transcriptional regulator, partial [Rhodocyclaceae bacterium]|nr:LysR family transcriptional regulator [Rhodocyclaceae bacterium]
RMAEHGAGIAVVSLAFVSEAIARGELVRLLPDWQAPSQTAWAVMPSRRLIPAKTRAFVELLIETLAGCESASATRPPETG